MGCHFSIPATSPRSFVQVRVVRISEVNFTVWFPHLFSNTQTHLIIHDIDVGNYQRFHRGNPEKRRYLNVEIECMLDHMDLLSLRLQSGLHRV